MRRLAPALLLLACGPLDPVVVDGSTAADSSTSAPSTAASTSSTSSPAATTTAAPTTTADATAADATTGEPACGPPCPVLRDLADDLEIEPGTDPQTFACVRRIDGDLEITGLPDGDILFHLGNLEEVTGDVSVRDNPGLTDLAGLACLRRAARVTVDDNPQLTSAAALAGLQSARAISLTDSPLLTELPALALAPAGGLEYLFIERVGVGDLDPLVDLRASPTLFYLVIRDCPALTSLTGAAALLHAATTPAVELQNLPALTALAGLDGIPAFESITLSRLPHIASLSELAGTQAIAYALYVDTMPALVDLHGLEDVAETEYLTLDDLPLLTDLGGLSGLTYAYHLSLDRLPALPDLAGLSALTTVGSRLDLGGCHDQDEAVGLDNIVDLTGLDALEVAWNVVIANNDSFAGFSGAPNLKMVSELHAVHNPSLAPGTLAAWAASLDPAPKTCESPDFDTCSCFAIDP